VKKIIIWGSSGKQTNWLENPPKSLIFNLLEGNNL
jgi:hypothetical protein